LPAKRALVRALRPSALHASASALINPFAFGVPARSGPGGGGGPEVDDGKADGSFHSPAFLAAHIASLQARAALG
jgi:hypothetical protein